MEKQKPKQSSWDPIGAGIRLLAVLGTAAFFYGMHISAKEAEKQVAEQTRTRYELRENKISEKLENLVGGQGTYALLVAGEESERERFMYAGRDDFYLAVWKAYDTVRMHGAKPENVFVLDKYQRIFYYPSDGLCTSDNIDSILNAFADKLKPVDRLIVGITGHGKLGSVAMLDGDYEASRLHEKIDVIQAEKGLVVVDACQAAIFAFGDRYTYMAGSGIGNATGEGSDSFMNHVFAGYQGMADKDLDGQVSDIEAFDYAKARMDEACMRNGCPASDMILNPNGEATIFSKGHQ